MKKLVLLSLASAFCLNFSAQAQLKRLTQQQTFGNQPSLTNNLNMLRGWSDDNHYIEFDAKTRALVAVDIKTGTKTGYTPPPKSDVDVKVKENDVYIQYGSQDPKRLTNNTDAEQNPTLSPDGNMLPLHATMTFLQWK